MTPYPAYKASGIEWLGDIPAHWEVKKLKHFSEIINGSTPQTGNTEYWDEGEIVWLTPNDLGKLDGKRIDNSSRRITEKGLNSCGTSLTPPNSIVLSTRAPIGHIAITTISSCTNQGCRTIVSELTLCDVNYVYYLLYSQKEELQSLGQGSTFTELSGQNLGNFRIPFPSLSEQRAIATYLDHKTSLIDTYLAKKQQQIDRLQAYRTALINQAVTKGLNPAAPMKASGIEWLGDIPAHWEVHLVKRHFKVELGKMLNQAKQSEEDLVRPYLRAANIKWEQVDVKEVSVNEMGFTSSQLERYRLRKGDLLVTEGGVTVGRSAIWKDEFEECYYQNSLNRVRPKGKVDTKFMYYWMYFLTENGYIGVVAEKSTFGHLTQENFLGETNTVRIESLLNWNDFTSLHKSYNPPLTPPRRGILVLCGSARHSPPRKGIRLSAVLAFPSWEGQGGGLFSSCTSRQFRFTAIMF